MPWLQLHVTVPAEHAASLETLLQRLGAHSVTLCDREDTPILEPGVGETPLWPTIRASALFDTGVKAADIVSTLQADFGSNTTDINFEQLKDKAWEREWLKYFEPVRCGERLWICPGEQAPPDPHAVNLLLDPGLAFGTGTHETTRLCLQWLDRANLAGQRVLDFGCGSGILGIAALLLGASHATFSDNDPQALQASRDNLGRNALTTADWHICHAKDYKPPIRARFDVVLANILAGPLVELAPILQASLVAGGQLVLSGLREEQANAVQSAYASTIEFDPPAQENGWLRLSGTRRPD
ncbi:MAG: 50S ribosomal protein L11 methyltransferase [Gammaproteobacteria bacterium]|nr:50S ribosomal protein L11 methyltransferase [Gammaproteobacteria bacterium]MBT8150967.1 50S ribosomal protein L11 methyltransferase [Gammaproteobacteria bacterium]NND38298.1 50S ribosomal protein L11 methyltransferase [Pseudomonadales bacterium]NNM11474.1 50S ribosomal protein L11 methyltransferase [Pseudomonadales bacterium]